MPVDIQRLQPPADVATPEKILALLDRSDAETIKAVVRWLVGEDARAARIVAALIA